MNEKFVLLEQYLEDKDFGYGFSYDYFLVSVENPDWKIKDLKKVARKLGFSCRKKGNYFELRFK